MKTFSCAIVMYCLYSVAGLADATAHEWKIGRARVEATVQGFDGHTVTFQRTTGRVFRVPLESLAPADLRVLRDVLELKGMAADAGRPPAAPAPAGGAGRKADLELIRTLNSQRAVALLEQSLEVQTAQYWSQWYDMWIVQFSTPAGQAFWVTSPARNSYDAEMAARRRYPNCSVLWVRRLNR